MSCLLKGESNWDLRNLVIFPNLQLLIDHIFERCLIHLFIQSFIHPFPDTIQNNLSTVLKKIMFLVLWYL